MIMTMENEQEYNPKPICENAVVHDNKTGTQQCKKLNWPDMGFWNVAYKKNSTNMIQSGKAEKAKTEI